MSRHTRWTIAALAAALVLTTGTPATATDTSHQTLRTVELTTSGNGYISDVNARGEILGALYDEINGAHRVLWRRYDTPIDLGFLPGAGHALNNRGDVLGRDWLWSRGRVQYLRHPSQPVWAVDINDHGQVVGNLDVTETEPTRAFLWQRGQFTNLGAPAGTSSYAISINNRGDVLGYVVNQGSSIKRAFVWRDGFMTFLDAPGGNSFEPRAINDQGQVIGSGSPAGSDLNHPFLWQRGRTIDLMAGRSEENGYAYDINNAGDVVGYAGNRPILWRDGHTIDVAPPDRWGHAYRINERGDIAGVFGNFATSDEDGKGWVFRWRDGRVLLADPVTDHQSANVQGVDERGRVTGTILDENSGRVRPVVWIGS
jgi:probable HAF family extracellular repeat protein